LSLGTLALNVGIKVGREVLVMRRLAAFKRSARPQSTVVREGRTRSIDPNRVVPGDVLIVGPGDQFLVDGQAVGPGRMVVDASVVTGEQGWQTVRAGDAVYAGSFCISGRGAYTVQKVGDERLIVSRMADTPARASELTSLESLVDRILRALLVLVAVFAAILIAAYLRLDLGIPVDLFHDAASVIFNIAPSSLFLMIVVTYAAGTADLVRRGALVHHARSVESLAEATVICFTEVGILAGTSMEMVPLPQPPAGDTEHLPESRLRQILGDYARSTSAPNLVTRILTNSFEGDRRAVREETPFLAALGWSAITFDERDVRGVFVLGELPILEDYLVTAAGQSEKGQPRSPATAVRQLVSPLRRLLKRSKQEPAGETGEKEAPEQVVDEEADSTESAKASEERQALSRRWAKQVGQLLRRTEHRPEKAEASSAAAAPETVLLFAYHPEPVSLYDLEGDVRLPGDLIPLCELRYTRRLRPEAVEVVQGFVRTGVNVKVFASDEPDQVLAMLQEAGLRKEDEERLLAAGAISGRDLEQLSPPAWERTVAGNSIFGRISSAQAGALVRALRESGESVAVVGDGATDLPALREANLAIARQTSTQAALGVADIVMLGTSPKALLKVLYRGQAIVHGLMDVLKLNLTQVVCLALLIAAIPAVGFGFPYVAAQSTTIAIMTVTIPSVGLSLWATPGVASNASFGRTLARFVAPAAVSMSLAALIVYLYFLDQTGQVVYAQLAVTYTLIYAGLLLAVFVKPPRRSWAAGQGRPGRAKRDGILTREWRMTGLALLLGIAVFFLPAIPAAQRYLRLDWLQQPADYGVVAVVVVGWALMLSFIWWLIPPAQPVIHPLV